MNNSLFRRKNINQAVQELEGGNGLLKTLGLRDLVSFGIAAIIGAGIFSTIGLASYNGGPAVSLLFVFVAIACIFTALCYAQFASMVPVSGSAYTYAYVSFGELFAWIIGWALILEYAIGNIVVAISWSGYFVNLLEGFHIHLPGWLSTNYETAEQGCAGDRQLPGHRPRHPDGRPDQPAPRPARPRATADTPGRHRSAYSA